jgi:acyl dehydratase
MSAGKRRAFEEMTNGEVIISQAITVTETHVVNFAGITGDFHPLHMNETFAREAGFSGRIAHGPLVFSICTGLFTQADPLDTIAFLGMDWKLVKPVNFGDTIHVRSTLQNTRTTSKGDRVIVQHLREILNQNDEVVQQGTTHMMMRLAQN